MKMPAEICGSPYSNPAFAVVRVCKVPIIKYPSTRVRSGQDDKVLHLLARYSGVKGTARWRLRAASLSAV